MAYNYYERKRKAIEDSVAEIHRARKAYVQQVERYNFTKKGLDELEFQIKNALDDKLTQIRNNFVAEAKNPVQEELVLYQSEKANKKSKMSKEERILQALEFQNKVTKLQAKVQIAGDGALLIQDLAAIQDEDLFDVFKGMLIANTSEEHKADIRQVKYVDEQLAELQDRVTDFRLVESDLGPMFGVNYGGKSFEEVVESEVFGRELSNKYFSNEGE